eukprot:4438785-Alexandrium_andersonii.AAC.1
MLGWAPTSRRRHWAALERVAPNAPEAPWTARGSRGTIQHEHTQNRAWPNNLLPRNGHLPS